MNKIRIEKLLKSYQVEEQTITALNNISLDLEVGELTVLLGPSGCGKTTLLRILAGLEPPTCGEVKIPSGSDGASLKFGVVFQEPRLMPWLTVSENISFGSELPGDSAQVREILCLLGLEGFSKAYPRQLSGGMAQRAALGRTLFQNPDVILMDEPFAALDYLTRINLQDELLELFIRQKKTILFVTHDVEEAAYLAQRVLVMRKGEWVLDEKLEGGYPRERHDPMLAGIRQKLLTVLRKNDNK